MLNEFGPCSDSVQSTIVEESQVRNQSKNTSNTSLDTYLKNKYEGQHFEGPIAFSSKFQICSVLEPGMISHQISNQTLPKPK